MKLSSIFGQWEKKDLLKLLAAQLMLGFFLGYLFFYDVFYYFSAPFDSSLSVWLLIFLLGLTGVLIGFLFPDPRIAMASSVTLPFLGVLFCFILFISPTFSPAIISSNLSDDLFILARLILIDIILSFLVIFVSSFISLYIFDAEYGGEDIFGGDK